MFTVKHVERDGREAVVSVDSVAFDKEANCLVGYGRPVTVEGVSDMASAPVLFRWTSGSAYVMNEQGKTVSVYNIALKTEPARVSEEQVRQTTEQAHRLTR